MKVKKQILVDAIIRMRDDMEASIKKFHEEQLAKHAQATADHIRDSSRVLLDLRSQLNEAFVGRQDVLAIWDNKIDTHAVARALRPSGAIKPERPDMTQFQGGWSVKQFIGLLKFLEGVDDELINTNELTKMGWQNLSSLFSPE